MKTIFSKINWHFSRLLFFITNIWDFKFDFPIPPKKFRYRIFIPSFWSTMLHIYFMRKTDANKYDNVAKKLWSEKTFHQESFEKWLCKVFYSQYGTVIDNDIFDMMCVKETTKIFEAGCGSGGAAACLLLRIFSNRYPNGELNDEYKKLYYMGIDLSEERIITGKKFLPILFNHYKSLIDLDFKKGDISDINAQDKYFDFSFVPSVLERIDDNNINQIISELCRVTNKGIFITDVADKYPLGYSRSPLLLDNIFKKNNFSLQYHNYLIPSSKMKYQCELHAYFKRI
jgi:SAM-dependent methyltransferase